MGRQERHRDHLRERRRSIPRRCLKFVLALVLCLPLAVWTVARECYDEDVWPWDKC